MKCVEILFWIAAAIVFYTYIGYGILLWILVRVKEALHPSPKIVLPTLLPRVTLLIAAYNEQDIVAQKMINTLELDYPAELMDIVWVTDGTTDNTNELLGKYARVKVLFDPARCGKSAAVNRAMGFIDTPIVIFTDANTMICSAAVREIVARFADPKVGCVAGEKRIAQSADAAATEGVYWRYESTLKELDSRLYSTMGAAGELYAIRRELYIELPHDTLLDDFVMSMKIAQRGYKIAYCSRAYAVEPPSEDMSQESKRKVRISAGGLQSIVRLSALLNIFRYGVLSFQYISHRVLRWSLTPVLFFALLPLGAVLGVHYGIASVYGVLFILQILFYAAAIAGVLLARAGIESGLLFVPYYFIFMNFSVFRGALYLRKHRGSGVWEKAQRKNG